MNSIENELRDLAIDRNADVPPPMVPPRLKQRVRIRKAVLSLGTAVVVVGLLVGTSWMLPLRPSNTAPPADMEKAGKPVRCFKLRTPENACPGVELSIELPQQSVRSGGRLTGLLVFHNTNPFTVILDGDQPEIADFLDPSTGRRVGGWDGAVAGSGWGAIVAPDETASMPLSLNAVARVKDFDLITDHQPPLSEGEYLLRATTDSCKPMGGPCTAFPPAYARVTVVSP